MTNRLPAAALFLFTLILSCTAVDEYRVAGIHPDLASNSVELAYANNTNFVYGVEICTNLPEGSWHRLEDRGMVYSEGASNSASITVDSSPGCYCRLQRMAVEHSLPQVTTQSQWLMRTEEEIGVDAITGNDVLDNTVFYYAVSNYISARYDEVFQFPGGMVETWIPEDFTIPAGKQFLYDMQGGGDGYTELPFSYAGDWQLIHPSGSAPRTMTIRIEWNARNHYGTEANPAPDYCAVVTISGPHDYVKRFEPVYNDGHVYWNSLEVPDELNHVAWDWEAYEKPDDGYYTIQIDIKAAPTLSTGLDGPTIGTIEKQVYLYNW